MEKQQDRIIKRGSELAKKLDDIESRLSNIEAAIVCGQKSCRKENCIFCLFKGYIKDNPQDKVVMEKIITYFLEQ